MSLRSDNPVIAHFDGLTEPNPCGWACGGYVILPHDTYRPSLIGGGACFGRGDGMTNNVAEYRAALLVLVQLWRDGWRGPVLLRGDSQLVVRQYSGDYACNAPLLVPLLGRLRDAGTQFAGLTLEWVPREQNEAADEQSRLAYRDATGRDAPVRAKAAR